MTEWKEKSLQSGISPDDLAVIKQLIMGLPPPRVREAIAKRDIGLLLPDGIQSGSRNEVLAKCGYACFDEYLPSLAEQWESFKTTYTTCIIRHDPVLNAKFDTIVGHDRKLPFWLKPESDEAINHLIDTAGSYVLDFGGRHAQTMRNSQLVIFWLGDPNETIFFYYKLLQARMAALKTVQTKRSDDVDVSCQMGDEDFYKRVKTLNESAYDYGRKPGVFIIDGFNMVDNTDCWSCDEARKKAVGKTNYWLASFEALAMYAYADPELFRAQDQRKLPTVDLAGTEVRDGKCEFDSFSFTLSTRGHRNYEIGLCDSSFVCSPPVARPSFTGVQRIL
ncbi:MAG: hypothetical protein LBK50_01755 [Candidatus Nomurabacteria bacterium]|nr:hypothetical protein [Candidatus Nomurabacteria bacterium]